MENVNREFSIHQLRLVGFVFHVWAIISFVLIKDCEGKIEK